MAEPDAKRLRSEAEVAPESQADGLGPHSSEEVDSECEFQDTLPKPSLCPRRLRGRKVELVEKVNDDYLAMLNDHDRNLFYWNALESLPVKGRRVLDLGAGTGLLSLMAARLGASSVLAIDESPDMAEIARWSAEHNKLADKVSVVAGHSSSVTLAEDERADVIVSETFGVLLLQEHCLSSFEHARTHLAKPGAVIVPAGGRQFVWLLMSETLRAASSAFDAGEPDLRHVGRLRETSRVAFSTPGGFAVNALQDARALSERLQILELDFQTSGCADVPAAQTFRLRALGDGVVDAVVISWEVWSGEGRSLTTHAEDTSRVPWGFARDAHWGQGVQLVQDEAGADGLPAPFAVVEGEELCLTVRFSPGAGALCQFSLERLSEPQLSAGGSATGETRIRGASDSASMISPTPWEPRPEELWLAEDACAPLLCDTDGDAQDVVRYEDELAQGFVCPKRLRGMRSALVQVVNDDYFALLGHRKRLDFFRRALDAAGARNRRVLDLGAGAGQLSVVAAQEGAAHVLAVEACSEMAQLARESANRNGVAAVVQVAHALSSRLDIPDDYRADIIVCEPYDIFMTGQGVSATVDYLADARQRLAKPGAAVIPAGGSQCAVLVMSACLSNRSTVSGERQGGLSEVSLSNLGELLDTATLTQSRKKGFRWSCLPDLAFLCERTELFSVDFAADDRRDIPRTRSVVLEVLQDGFVDAVVTSWEVWAGADRSLRLSGHAEEAKDESWGFGQDVVFGQGIQLLADEGTSSASGAGNVPKPFAVRKGEAVTLTAHVSERRDGLHFTLRRGSVVPEQRRARGRGGRRALSRSGQ